MFEIRMETDDRAQAMLKLFPQFAEHAETSAVKSAGNEMRARMRRFIETGGEGWPAIGPFTRETRKSRGGPLAFLGRFIRYRFSRRGGAAQVTLGVATISAARRARLKQARAAGRMSRGELLTPLLMFRKAEKGKTYRVTARMRRAMAALGMPIRKGTETIQVPRRPIFEPVWRRERDRISSFLLERYMNAMLRYASGGVLGKKV
jgi:hypothetical protein